jgi:hypothetical protein
MSLKSSIKHLFMELGQLVCIKLAGDMILIRLQTTEVWCTVLTTSLDHKLAKQP